MGRSQREKGKRNERLAAKALGDHLGIRATRTAQHCGRTGVADLDIGDKLHAEVKVRKSIAACRYHEQAEHDRIEGATPFVLMREDRGEWFVLVKLSDIETLMESLQDARQAEPPDDIAGGATSRPDHRDHRGDDDDRKA